MDREARVPDLVYRVAGRHKTTQQCFFEDFCDLKSVQTEVKKLNAELPTHIEYYIDAVRLDQLPESKRIELLDRNLITQAQFDRVASEESTLNSIGASANHLKPS